MTKEACAYCGHADNPVREFNGEYVCKDCREELLEQEFEEEKK